MYFITTCVCFIVGNQNLSWKGKYDSSLATPRHAFDVRVRMSNERKYDSLVATPRYASDVRMSSGGKTDDSYKENDMPRHVTDTLSRHVSSCSSSILVPKEIYSSSTKEYGGRMYVVEDVDKVRIFMDCLALDA